MLHLKHTFLLALAFAIGILSNRATAQVQTTAQREFEADEGFSGCLSMLDKGVAIYGFEDKTTFTVKTLNTELEDITSWTWETAKKATLGQMSYYEAKGLILVLMQESKTEYTLTALDPSSKQKKSSSFEIPKGTTLNEHFTIIGSDIWFTAFTKKAEFMYRLNIETPKLVPFDPKVDGDKPSYADIQDLGNGEVALVYFKGPKKAREAEVNILNTQGNTILKNALSSLTPLQREQIINASVTRIAEGDYSFTGTYNKKGNSMGNGVYFARYSDKKVRYFSNFDYSDFEHFYDFLSDKQRDKVEAKIEKKKSKGKEVTISYQSVMHQAVAIDGGLAFIGEYYYPTYRTETTTRIVNGVAQTSTRRVFDGYEYSHGMAIGIDNNGKKLWDLMVPIHLGFKPFNANRFFRIASDSSTIQIVHTAGRRIFSSAITDGEIQNNEFGIINVIPEGEKEKWSASTGIYWYEDYFFIMEMQKTKERGLVGKRKIKFYATKVQVLN